MEKSFKSLCPGFSVFAKDWVMDYIGNALSICPILDYAEGK